MGLILGAAWQYIVRVEMLSLIILIVLPGSIARIEVRSLILGASWQYSEAGVSLGECHVITS